MLSSTAEYALRAVVYLAHRAEEPRTAAMIADATCVPQRYLSKILGQLARTGIVTAQRGRGGGFVLGKSPKAISVLDVLAATDNPLQNIDVCPLGISDHTTLCPLHRVLNEAIETVRASFARTTIASLAATTRAAPLCELTTPKARTQKVTGKRSTKRK